MPIKSTSSLQDRLSTAESACSLWLSRPSFSEFFLEQSTSSIWYARCRVFSRVFSNCFPKLCYWFQFGLYLRTRFCVFQSARFCVGCTYRLSSSRISSLFHRVRFHRVSMLCKIAFPMFILPKTSFLSVFVAVCDLFSVSTGWLYWTVSTIVSLHKDYVVHLLRRVLQLPVSRFQCPFSRPAPLHTGTQPKSCPRVAIYLCNQQCNNLTWRYCKWKDIWRFLVHSLYNFMNIILFIWI